MTPKDSLMRYLVLQLLLCCSLPTDVFSAPTAQPNVIFIMADDLGSVDLGCYGAKDLHTPHTDRLAASGVRFTQFYSAAPVCSPSRAGALTGRRRWHYATGALVMRHNRGYWSLRWAKHLRRSAN